MLTAVPEVQAAEPGVEAVEAPAELERPTDQAVEMATMDGTGMTGSRGGAQASL